MTASIVEAMGARTASKNNMPSTLPALAAELAGARDQTDSLFRLISSEALYSRPIAERHRLIFYLGHFDAFDWNLLARRTLGAPSFHPSFDSLFERGIDPAHGQGPTDAPRDWPSESEILQYNASTRRWIDTHLDDLDPWILQMAIEHRHMHAETFAYLLHGLPCDAKSGPAPETPSARPAPDNPMVAAAAGCATLGQPARFRMGQRVPRPRDLCSRLPDFEVQNLERRISRLRPRRRTRASFLGTRKRPVVLSRHVRADPPSSRLARLGHAGSRRRHTRNGAASRCRREAQFQRAASLRPPDASRDNFGYRRWDPVPVDADDLDQATSHPAKRPRR